MRRAAAAAGVVRDGPARFRRDAVPGVSGPGACPHSPSFLHRRLPAAVVPQAGSPRLPGFECPGIAAVAGFAAAPNPSGAARSRIPVSCSPSSASPAGLRIPGFGTGGPSCRDTTLRALTAVDAGYPFRCFLGMGEDLSGSICLLAFPRPIPRVVGQQLPAVGMFCSCVGSLAGAVPQNPVRPGIDWPPGITGGDTGLFSGCRH